MRRIRLCGDEVLEKHSLMGEVRGSFVKDWRLGDLESYA